MSDRFDVIVIGAGVVGSSAAYHLAKDKHRTLLIEQFEIGHARGSSHGESRILRLAYHRPEYARLVMQALPMWQSLEAECGQRLLRPSGGLDLTDKPDFHPHINAIVDCLSAVGAPFDVLNAQGLRARFPQWCLGEAALGVYSPDTAILSATRCVESLIQQAARLGLAVHEKEPVTKVNADPGQVEVTTSKGRYHARRLVITGGAWVNTLLGDVRLHLPLRVLQEQYIYFRPRRNAELFALGRFPIFIHWGSGDIGYGFPILDNGGLKTGFHVDNYEVTPDTYDCRPRPSVTERVSAYLRRYLPDAAGEPFDAQTCLYTLTPDEDFVIDLVPGLPNVAVSSSCSGHGFKFGPAIGRALADLLAHGMTPMEIGHVRLRNFGSSIARA